MENRKKKLVEVNPVASVGAQTAVRPSFRFHFSNFWCRKASLEKAPKIDGFLLEVLSLVAINYGHDPQSGLMKYFKCLFAGLVAVFVICIFLPALPTIVRVSVPAIKHLAKGEAIAVGPVSWRAPSTVQWLFMFAVFGGGFLWELRRLAKRRLPPPSGSTNLPIS